MIDIHFHCLPGVDDGPRTWPEAVDLCRMAADGGVDTIVATPHVLRDPWLNEDSSLRDALVSELNDRLGGAPVVVPGCELYISSDVVDLVSKGASGPVTTLNRGRHILLEFPATSIPRDAEESFHELTILGYTVVIAHPERNLVFAQDESRLARFVARGAKVQVTAGSLLGDFGRGALRAAERFWHQGLIDVIASDAHSSSRRPPRLGEARQWAAREWGEEAALALFTQNPKQIISGSDDVANAKGEVSPFGVVSRR